LKQSYQQFALQPFLGGMLPQKPKIDRGACPRLISRFIEQEPQFLYGPSDRALTVAQQTGPISYDIAGVELGHIGALCTFDAFLGNGELRGRALQALAVIIRDADSSYLGLSPQRLAAPWNRPPARALCVVRRLQGETQSGPPPLC
jgi:hypothetical protein